MKEDIQHHITQLNLILKDIEKNYTKNKKIAQKGEQLKTVQSVIDQLKKQKLKVPEELMNQQESLADFAEIAEDFDESLELLYQYSDDFRKRIKDLRVITSPKRKRKPSKHIKSFTFASKEYPVRNWIQMLIMINEIMVEKHPKQYDRVCTLHGNTRPYYSKNSEELRVPYLIPGSDIYMEKNVSVPQIQNISYEMLKLFGYNRSDLTFEME